MTTIPFDLTKITGRRFAKGNHDDNSADLCVMEAVAYVAGEKHSDHPQCVSPVIAAALRSWNDILSDPPRTELLAPLVPHLIGTRTTEADEITRAWMATDWMVRTYTPAWLRLAGLNTDAQHLEALARIVDTATSKASAPALKTAKTNAAAAWDAAGAAAGAAAWAAARAAARDAAGAAAWAAARDAAGDAARDAARDAAWAAARDAAWAAAWDAAGAAARDAAGAGAREKLAPTVTTLQASFQTLILAMCEVGRATPSTTTQ